MTECTKDHSTEVSAPREYLVKLKEVVKALPLNERKQAAMLYTLYEEIVTNIEAEEKDNDKIFSEYADSISKITTQMDELIEGKRKVTDEEINQWKDLVEPTYAPTEADNNGQPIKSFWRKFIQNSDIYHSEKDQAMLDHITHVEISDEEDKANHHNRHLILKLKFSSNEFFNNEELSVKIVSESGVVSKTEGTVIDWKKGNPTIKKTTKNQKNKKTGQTRVIVKETQLRSFFELFNNYNAEDNEEEDKKHDNKGNDEDEPSEMDLYMVEQTVNDFNDLMPYALEYYLGVNEKDDGEDEDEEDEEEDDDEDDEENQTRQKLGKKKVPKKDSKKPSRKASEADKKETAPAEGQPKQECKQQ